MGVRYVFSCGTSWIERARIIDRRGFVTLRYETEEEDEMCSWEEMVSREHWCRDSEISFGAARQAEPLVSDDCPEAERIRNRYTDSNPDCWDTAGKAQDWEAGQRYIQTIASVHFPLPLFYPCFLPPCVPLLPLSPEGPRTVLRTTQPAEWIPFPLLSPSQVESPEGSSKAFKSRTVPLRCHLEAK